MKKLRNLLTLAPVVALGLGCDAPSVPDGAEGAPSQPHNPAASALITPVHVKVAAVRVADVQRQATVAGVVEAFRTATIAAETNGRVIRRAVEPGDRVGTGQVLVTLDKERALITRDQANATVRAREIDLQQAANEWRRGEDLRSRDFISEDMLERLKFTEVRARAVLDAARAELAAAERLLSDTEVRAPFPGVAETVHVHQGDYLNPGTPVATLADFSKVRIKAGVTAREATLLRGADEAEVTLDALGPEPLRGTIHSLARMADAATGTYTMEVWLEDPAYSPSNELREGMLATVYLPRTATTTRLAVPSTAVFRRGGTMHVFVVVDRNAHLRPVRTGHTNGPTIEVLDGLADGELVVTDGQFALRDGASVTVES